jgi:hypothetical protein
MKEQGAVGAVVPGQIWTYKTRPAEADSHLTILKRETHPKLGTIVHISVDGLRMKNRGCF